MSAVTPQRDGEKAVNFYVDATLRDRLNEWLSVERYSLADVGRVIVDGLPRLRRLVWTKMLEIASVSGRSPGALLAEWIETGYRHASQGLLTTGEGPQLALAGPGLAPEGGAHDVDTQDRKRLDQFETRLAKIEKMLSQALRIRTPRPRKAK